MMLDYLPLALFEQTPCHYTLTPEGALVAQSHQGNVRSEHRSPPGIFVDTALARFYLQGQQSSYVLRVAQDGTLIHEHWGCPTTDLGAPIEPPVVQGWATRQGSRSQELPGPSGVDRRPPALLWQGSSGALACQLRVIGANIVQGKPKLPHLPTTFATKDRPCTTLALCLMDPARHLHVWSYYSFFPKTDTLTRWLSIRCTYEENAYLTGAASFSVDLPPRAYKALGLTGRWSAEAKLMEQSLHPGICRWASRYGFSGHEHNPSMIIAEAHTHDHHGPAWGLALVYSGDFWVQACIAADHSLRWQIGLGQEGFRWRMKPGQIFITPESVAAFSPEGTGGLSRSLHQFWRHHLCPNHWQHRNRPIKLNTWEACYFAIDGTTCQQLAQAAAPLGVKLLVIDDGWFGQRYPRQDDTTSLGDWQINLNKFPGGWPAVKAQLAQANMDLGIWLEPEMVSVQSELYQQHPAWCLQIARLEGQEVRHQRILDLSQWEVQQWLITTISDVLKQASPTYVKWDANRGMSEIGSSVWPRDQQGEVAHRYLLGLYRVLEEITQAFPQILFEHCASGGGRFDAGMLHYMPQGWLSDNTDARERLRMQWGLGFIYPPATMVAHMARSPHHQMGRTTSWAFRAHVAAMTGCVGLELDVRQLRVEETLEIQHLLQSIQAIGHLVREGHLYRLQQQGQMALTSRWPAAMWVGDGGREAVVFAFQLDSEVGLHPPPLRLAGLRQDLMYKCEPCVDGSYLWSGATLMARGLPLRFTQDNQSVMLHLQGQER